MVDFALWNAFRALGLKRDASADEARIARQSLAKEFHPDISTRPDAPERMAEVNAAYDLVSAHLKSNPPRSTWASPQREGPTLSDEQRSAFERILDFAAKAPDKTYFTMHGFAGSGKTTVLSAVARELPSALICTLTGKAADVLRRKTGLQVDTIHSTFYDLNHVEHLSDGDEELHWSERWQKDDLSGRLVLLDEVSMVNEEMARDMLRTGCKIIAVGDPGQLPPVVGQQFFTKPNVTLQKIHRQALDSPIIRQAHRIRLGMGYRPDGDAFRVVRKPTREEVAAADAVLCWKNDTRKSCNRVMRRNAGFKKDHPEAGEPVLCFRNAMEYGLFNGCVYTLAKDFRQGDSGIHLQMGDRSVFVPDVVFEDMDEPQSHRYRRRPTTKFGYGYALTVHKAQGSEFPRVILFDEYDLGEDETKWLYTGVTRAAERITIVKP